MANDQYTIEASHLEQKNPKRNRAHNMKTRNIVIFVFCSFLTSLTTLVLTIDVLSYLYFLVQLCSGRTTPAQ